MSEVISNMLSAFSVYMLTALFVFGLAGLSGFCIARYQQGLQLGVESKPLSSDDRLRLSLAYTALEQAEKELAKAAWRDNLPGHPLVSDLLHDSHQLSNRALKLLRES